MKYEKNANARCRRVDEAAEARLHRSQYVELRGICCEFHEGVLTLRGQVPSYYLKQMAQSLVDRIPGVLQLDNQLDVGRPRAADGRSGGPSHPAPPARRRPR